MIKKLALAAITLACLSAHAWAQTYRDSGGTVVPGVVPLSGCTSSGVCTGPVTSGNPLPVTGTFTASLGGFTPSTTGARMTPLAVTTSDSSTTLPSGAVTVVSNVGSNPMYCNVNGTAATTSDQLIPANGWFAFTIPVSVTALHCIATGGSTTANGVGGAGLPTGAGGASAGLAAGAATSANQATEITALGTINTTLGTPFQAGGSVGITGTLPAFAATPTFNLGTLNGAATAGNQTAVQSAPGTPQTTAMTIQGNASGVAVPVSVASQPLPTGAATAANQHVTAAGTSDTSAQAVQGVTGGVPLPAVLTAGSAIAGKVGIDQTTPGTTNAVAANQNGTWAVTPTLTTVSTLSLTSSTTAYTSGQLVANNGTAGSITNPSFSMPSAGGAITRLRLFTTDTLSTAWASASVQVDLWSAAPTWTNGDHATWLPATGAASHIASYSCTFPSAVWGDGIATECTINQGNYASTVATTIYWSVQATSGSGVLTASKAIKLVAELN